MSSSSLATAPSHIAASSQASLFTRVGAMFGIHRERRALASLEPHMLRDIGVSQDDARREASRPAWDMPSRLSC